MKISLHNRFVDIFLVLTMNVIIMSTIKVGRLAWIFFFHLFKFSLPFPSTSLLSRNELLKND